MEYQVIYDFMNAPSEWVGVWNGLKSVGFGIALIVLAKPYSWLIGKPYGYNLAVSIIWTAFASLLCLVNLSTTVPDYYRYKNRLDHQQYMIVEGEIRNFHINVRGTAGKFIVNEVQFVLGYHDVGFDAGDPERRSLAEGMIVKIYYLDESDQYRENLILRIERINQP